MLTEKIRTDFPVFTRKINGNRLVYLDNSATSQCPKKVIDELSDYYLYHRANVHRGVHTLSEESTDMYEAARKVTARFLNVKNTEVAFVKNATEGANLIAFSFLPANLKKGDTILVSKYEHHSNILPWVESAKLLGLNVKQIPFTKGYAIDYERLSKMDFTFLAVNQVSNFLGSVNDISKIADVCHKKGAYLFVDGAQGIPHLPSNVTNLGCDFYTFSGHKIYAPFGTGALYIKDSLVSKTPPFMFGGGMIKSVTLESGDYLNEIEKFDAGTPNIGGAIALASALKYFESIGKKAIFSNEEKVLHYLYSQLSSQKDIQVYGPTKAEKRVGLVSFNLKGVHSHDLASILDSEGVAVRSGQHCTMPAHKGLGLVASVRASIGLYNFQDDIDALMEGINIARKVLK
jgi:cysteine desulfurase/selenocysteine lyase